MGFLPGGVATPSISERRIIRVQSLMGSMSLKPITFRLSEKELRYLEVMAEKQGMSGRSEFLRGLIRSSMVRTDLDTGTHWTDVRPEVTRSVPAPVVGPVRMKSVGSSAATVKEPTGFDRLMIERFIRTGMMMRDEQGRLWEADEESKGLIMYGKKPKAVRWSLFSSR